MNNIFSFPIEETTRQIQHFIKDTLSSAHFSNIIIGVSGGVDSAVSLTLAVSAVGSTHVYPVLLPCGNTHEASVDHAKELLTILNIPEENRTLINIEKTVHAVTEDIQNTDNIRKGNIMARVRMMYLFDRAKELQGLVCGTENKSEHLLGYFTRFGDEASDIEPIQSLYKTQVWEMAKFLMVPSSIISKAPTAGLWEEQTDEKELGFSYLDADVVLYYAFEKHLSENEIVKKGIEKDVVTNVLQRVRNNAFKHNLPKVFS